MGSEGTFGKTVIELLMSMGAVGLLPKNLQELVSLGGKRYYFRRCPRYRNVKGKQGPGVTPLERSCGFGKTHLVAVGPLPRHHTDAMIHAREVFADAVGAWGVLTDEEMRAWNKSERAQRKVITGYNAFIGDYMEKNC